jgi:hypothetical protein
VGLGLVGGTPKGMLPGEGGYEGDVSSEALTSRGSSEDWSSVEERGEKQKQGGSASGGSCSGRSSGKSPRVTLRSLLEGPTQAESSSASRGRSESPQQQTPGSDVDCCGRAP